MFHLIESSQLYTLLFCLWFLVLGAIEYFVITLYLATLVLAGGLNVNYRQLAAYFAYSPSPKGTFMDKQSLRETAKRLALELPFVELCWPFGPEFDVLKLAARFYAVVGATQHPL